VGVPKKPTRFFWVRTRVSKPCFKSGFQQCKETRRTDLVHIVTELGDVLSECVDSISGVINSAQQTTSGCLQGCTLITGMTDQLVPGRLLRSTQRRHVPTVLDDLIELHK